MSKDTVFIASIILIVVIGVVLYDYQVRKIFADTTKRIAMMGKKVVKSPAVAWAFILGLFWGNEKD